MSDNLPQDPQYTWLLRQVVERVNGFVYAGDRANAVVDTVKALRADPVLASGLLGGGTAPASRPPEPQPASGAGDQAGPWLDDSLSLECARAPQGCPGCDGRTQGRGDKPCACRCHTQERPS